MIEAFRRVGYEQGETRDVEHDYENTTVRPFQDTDETEVVSVWHSAGRAAYMFLPTWQSLTLERAGEIFREVVRARCNIWVGTRNDRVVAFLAMNGSYIGWMYVAPAEWRKGWGTRLLSLAKTLFPEGLELHTHQENHVARELYEKHGFKAVKFGVSPAPENAPDVEYHWRPGR
jgi:ribosomal protein S18 acetylase RimI-like enzyme